MMEIGSIQLYINYYLYHFNFISNIISAMLSDKFKFKKISRLNVVDSKYGANFMMLFSLNWNLILSLFNLRWY